MPEGKQSERRDRIADPGRLSGSFQAKEKAPRTLGTRLRGWCFDHLGLKIGSLIIAIFAFGLVRGAEDAQRSIFVNLAASLPPASSGKMLISELPDRIRLTIKGSRSRINKIKEEELGALQIDLTDARGYFYFEDRQFDLPAGVTVTQLTPASTRLVWADRASKTLPIVPKLSDRPNEHLVMKAPATVKPTQVTLSGPDSELQNLRSILTKPLSLSGYGVGSHTQKVPLENPPAHSMYDSPSQVEITFELVPDEVEKTFDGVKVTAEPLPKVAVPFSPAVVSITLKGPPKLLDSLDQPTLTAYIDSTQLATADSIPIKVRGLPERVTVLSITPEAVIPTR